MVIAYVSEGASGATNRTRINQAIDKANLVDGKADQSALAAEISSRQNGDNNLQGQINLRSTVAALNAEEQARQNADAGLQGQISQRVTLAQLASESGVRAAGDAACMDAVASEAQMRTAVIAAEAQARIAGDAVRATYAEMAAHPGRPGANPNLYTTQTIGSRASLPNWTEVTRGRDGDVAVIDGAAVIAAKDAFVVEPGRIVKVRYALRRAVNATAMIGNTVHLGIQWLDRDFQPVPGAGAVTIIEAIEITSSDGLQSREYNISLDGVGENVVAAPPLGAVFGRRFIRNFADGRLHVALLWSWDATDSVDFSAGALDFAGSLSALNYRVETVEQDMNMRAVMRLGDGTAPNGAAAAIFEAAGRYWSVTSTTDVGGYDMTRQFGFDPVDGRHFVTGGLKSSGQIDHQGNVAINGALTVNSRHVIRWVPVPATSASPGSQGDAARSSTHFYVCVATNTWRRVALSNW